MKEATDVIMEFRNFIQSNRDTIYANTPKETTISKDDSWFHEDEWDEIYHQTELEKK